MKITKKSKRYIERLAKALLGQDFHKLTEEEQSVIESIATNEPIAENTNDTFEEQLTFGQRLADRIAAFGGSRTFIVLFLGFIGGWMALNSMMIMAAEQFDPYPFILLNLVLSTLAAIQAPIILMSQNRQSAKDRHDTEKNFAVTLKSDLEIARLHQKIDTLTVSLTGNDRSRQAESDL